MPDVSSGTSSYVSGSTIFAETLGTGRPTEPSFISMVALFERLGGTFTETNGDYDLERAQFLRVTASQVSSQESRRGQQQSGAAHPSQFGDRACIEWRKMVRRANVKQQ